MKRSLSIALVFIAAGLASTSEAAVRKQATITSDPPGAKVWINGVFRGRTPVEIPYNWNWYYDFRLEAPGYQTYCIRERFYAPAKHWIPADLVAEIVPVRSKEDQWRHYQLVPVKDKKASTDDPHLHTHINQPAAGHGQAGHGHHGHTH